MCWHKWDIYKEVRPASYLKYVVSTKKVCRKCGQIRIKEKID